MLLDGPGGEARRLGDLDDGQVGPGREEVEDLVLDFPELSTELSTERAAAVRRTVAVNRQPSRSSRNPISGHFSILDEIDTVLAQHFSFTEEELDFIINYDIKYRMGRDTEDGDE